MSEFKLKSILQELDELDSPSVNAGGLNFANILSELDRLDAGEGAEASLAAPEMPVEQAPALTEQAPLPTAGVMDALRGGFADIVRRFGTSPSQTKYLQWAQGLSDEEYQRAAARGLVNPKMIGFSPARRAEEIGNTLALREGWNQGVQDVAGFVDAPPVALPEGPVERFAYNMLRMSPGVAVDVAAAWLMGQFPGLNPASAMGIINTVRGNAAAREQVFEAQQKQGKSVPEALEQADSLGWNVADIAARGATNWAAGQMFGRAPDIYGNVSPFLQRMGNVAAGAAISGAGSGVTSGIEDAWSGQDVDWGKAGRSAAGAAASSGMFGLFNMVLNAGKMRSEHTTWKQIKGFNDVVKEYGVPPLSRNGNNLRDVSEFIENVIASGQMPPERAMEMLTRLGLDQKTAAGAIQRVLRTPKLEGANEAEVAHFDQYSGGSELPPGETPGPKQPQPPEPGTPAPDGAGRARMPLEQIVSAARESVRNGAWTLDDVARMMTKEGYSAEEIQQAWQEIGQEPQNTLGGTLEEFAPQKGGLGQALEDATREGQPEAAPQETQPQQPRDGVVQWMDKHVVAGVVGRPEGQEGTMPEGTGNTEPVDKKWGLPEGYSIEGAENGRTLRGAKQHQFVLRNGNRDWGYVTEELAAGRPDVPVGPIRVQVGQRGWGLRHTHDKHMNTILKQFPSVEEYISHVIDDGNEVIPLGPDTRGRPSEFLIAMPKPDANQDSIIIAWEQEGYYTLKSGYSPRESYVERRRSSSPGSEPLAPNSASASLASATAGTSPRDNDRSHYEDDESQETVPQEGAGVKYRKRMPVTAWKEKVEEESDSLSQTSETWTTSRGAVSAVSPEDSSSSGRAAPKPIPAPVPSAADTAHSEPEGEANVPYGDNDSRLTVPQEDTGVKAETAGRSPSMTVAENVTNNLAYSLGHGKIEPITTKQLLRWADEAWGGTQAEGKYTIKDAYDAMEMGVNKAIQVSKVNPSRANTVDEASEDLFTLAKIEMNLPTQSNRTEEQNEFQQFSTPPRIAYAANWLLGAGEGDVVLEPSAGVGGLAVFAKNAGAEVVLNEISDRRADLLEEMGLGKVFRYNAEHIHDILPDDAVRPTKIIMNPPFSSTAGRVQGQRKTSNATKHVEQALERLEPGGRLVAILGKGMGDDKPAFRKWWRDIKSRYNVRANVELDGKEYKKYGTSFGNVIAVIDKDGPTPEGGTVTGKFEHIIDMLPPLLDVRNSAPRAKQAESAKENDVLTTKTPENAKKREEYAKAKPIKERQEPKKERGAAPKDGNNILINALIPPDADLDRDFKDGDLYITYQGADFDGAKGQFRQEKEKVRVTWGHNGVINFDNAYAVDEGRPAYGALGHYVVHSGTFQKGAGETWGPQFDAIKMEFARHISDFYKPGQGQEAEKPETPKAEREEAPKQEETPEAEPQPEAEPTVKVERKTEQERREELKADEGDDLNVYDNYRPSRMRIAGAKHHPADLVESAAMASVSMPEATYSPHLPERVIDEGLLSEAQLEAVVYAGQSFREKNPDGTRRGFFIGDGTGVGKGREISGILTDQMRQGHGRGKAVWVSDKAGLAKDAQRDWSGLGNDPEDIFPQQRTRAGDSIKNDKGILFTAYSTLRSKDRLEQVKSWLGKDFDGVIVLDEVHNANNATDSKGTRGTKKASQQALAILDLVKEFPDARVLYVSATGATEVKNLAMLDRLGLWGEGTPFADKRDFVAQIDAGGTAAMEIVARDMKAQGLYVARSLSQRAGPYGGKENVTFSRLTHALTPQQTAVYNKVAEGWQKVLQNIGKAVELCGGKDTKDAGRALSVFFSAEQKCFSQILTSLQTPAVIEAIKKDLKDGKSVVIQLTETGDAATKRALERLGDDENYDDLDVTPRDSLINFLKGAFPVNKLEEYTDDNGNVRYREVQDRDGKPVVSKEAVRLRDELIADINSIRFPETPLDMILDAFGTEQVAEITGRSQRIVRGPDGERIRETRSVSSREADKTAFNEGRKRILVFSEAGGTGASYHASLEYKNQQKRVHYLLQPGWKADKAMQGLGRSHRSNEAHKPHYILVETDLPAQKRFLSTIARRLEQLGALTTGERKTTTQGLFGERDNLESPHAKDAMRDMFAALIRGVYTDMGNPADVMAQLGYSYDRFKDADAASFPPVTQVLNRMLALNVDTQKKLFAHFDEAIDARVAWAIQNGELDMGTENVRADKIKVLQEKVVHEDARRGTETSYVELELQTKQSPVSFAEAGKRGFTEFYRTRNGAVVGAKKTKRTVTDLETGELKAEYQLISVDPRYHGQTRALDNAAFYTRLEEDEARRLWDEQAAELPEYHTEKKHLITGVLLPIWNRLSGSPRIQRVMTEDGRSYLGRIIPDSELAGTLGRLGMTYEGEKITPDGMFKKLEKLGTTALLGNGWKLRTVMLNGQKRIELLGADFTWHNMLRNAGAIIEQVNWQKRVFLPIGNEDTMRRVLDTSPVISFKAKDILEDAAETINENIPEDVSYRLNVVHPWFRPEIDPEENPFVNEVDAGKPAFEDPEVERRFQGSTEGVRPETGWARVRRSMWEFGRGFRADYPELAGKSVSGVDLHPAHELIRKLNREGGAQVQKAIKTLEAALKPLSPREFDIFRRVRMLQDLEYQKSTMPDSLLPYGWTDEAFVREHDRFMKLLEKEPKVKQAIEYEEATIAALNEEMIRAAETLGWHSLKDKFKNPHYFRHVVLEYANAGRAGHGKHNNGKAPDNRSYLKRREGSDKDISANYIQAMGEVRAMMFQDIATLGTLGELKKEYNISEDLKRQAFIMNEEAVKEQIEELLRKRNNFSVTEIPEDKMRERAEAEFRKTYNTKQAAALARLFTLAKNGALPEGDFGDVVQAMENAGSMEELPEAARRRFNRYLGWLAGLDERNAGRDTARAYFKGVQQKKKDIKAALGDKHVDWRDLIPDGYTLWDPFNSRLVFSVSAVPENILKMAEEELAKDPDAPLPLRLSDLVKMKVLGGHRQMWVIPTEIATTLDKMGEKKVRGLADNVVQEVITFWKKDVLFNPWRVLRSNLRNLSGDVDAALAGGPLMMRYFPRAWKELWGVYRHGRAATGDLKDFQERGGALTSESMQELYDWKGMREFRHLAPRQQENVLKRAWHVGAGYVEFAEYWSQWRESWLRYTAYLYFLNDMKKNNGTPTHWGASKPEEVMALTDIRDRAYKMANELLGAYDEISESGKRLRKGWFPFYSWIESNFKRQIQLFRNGMEGRSWVETEAKWVYHRLRDKLGGGAGGGGPRDPSGGSPAAGDEGDDWPRFNKTSLCGRALKFPLLTMRLAATLASMSSFWLMMGICNYLFHRDVEEKLPQDVKDRPHIVLCDNLQGKSWYFDRIGALPDFLDTFGLENFITDIRDIGNGKQTVGGMLTKIAEAPISKAWNALTPIIKMPVELAFGRTGFPDVFHSRPIRDSLDYIASSLGIRWPVSALQKLIEDKPGPDFFSREHLLNLAMYSTEPQTAAYYYILDQKRDFLENVLGRTFDGATRTKRSMALANVKTAMRYKDYPRVRRWIDEYAKLDGTSTGLKSSLRAMHPYAGLSREELARFKKWLSPGDMKYVPMAEAHWRELVDACREGVRLRSESR